MPWKTEYREGQVIRQDGVRFVRIPDDYVLEGEGIGIRQDKGGEICIYPTSPEGIHALRKFHPFGDWMDEEEGAAAKGDSDI
jgi:hypothetical protein